MINVGEARQVFKRVKASVALLFLFTRTEKVEKCMCVLHMTITLKE